MTLVPGLNARSGRRVDHPRRDDQRGRHHAHQGDLLRVSIAGVTDADNVSATNPTGAISGSVSYYWQFEPNPGTGVFEDIILLPAGDLAFQSADGDHVQGDPGSRRAVAARQGHLPGCARRDRAGVLGADRARHRGAPCAADPAGRAGPEATAGGAACTWSAPTSTSSSIRSRSPKRTRPARICCPCSRTCACRSGLRTVDGSFNNLVT